MLGRDVKGGFPSHRSVVCWVRDGHEVQSEGARVGASLRYGAPTQLVFPDCMITGLSLPRALPPFVTFSYFFLRTLKMCASLAGFTLFIINKSFIHIVSLS